MLIEGKNIHKDYGGIPVLRGVDFTISPGEKIGIVGHNGAGKSTLLRILCGQDEDFSGQCFRAPNCHIALVHQYFPDFQGSALEYIASDLLKLRGKLRELEEAMADPLQTEEALKAYGPLRERYDDMEGDGAEERAERFLESLGLEGSAHKPTAVLSGGERNILALAKALNGRPDLLVLDEPGNHLDIWGLSWLENFLAGIPQAVLMVSHNRYLLDRTVSRTVELDGGNAHSYAGGWSAYRMERLRKNAAQGMDWKADQKKLARLEELVKRFEQIARARPDPAWGKRLRARRSQLERARKEATEKPGEDSKAMELRFRADTSKADIAVAVSGYNVTLPNGRILFHEAELLVRSGERVGLVGPNGCGKSTFLTDLVHRGSWDDRTLRIGPSFTLGWCAQHQEVFDPQKTVAEEFLHLKAVTEEEVFTFLRRFLFTKTDMGKKITALSGGERNRLQLARAVFIQADLLILDEPTNHLDIPAREAIEEALAEFKGTLIVVSHDRYFLDQIVDRVVEIDKEGHFISWDGNFSEFWFKAYGNISPGFRKKDSPSSKERIGDRGRLIHASRQGKGNHAKEAGTDRLKLEERISSLEAERSILEHRSSQALTAGDYKNARRIGNALEELTGRIEELYRRWTD